MRLAELEALVRDLRECAGPDANPVVVIDSRGTTYPAVLAPLAMKAQSYRVDTPHCTPPLAQGDFVLDLCNYRKGHVF